MPPTNLTTSVLGILRYSLLPRGASLIPAPGVQPPFTLQPPLPPSTPSSPLTDHPLHSAWKAGKSYAVLSAYKTLFIFQESLQSIPSFLSSSESSHLWTLRPSLYTPTLPTDQLFYILPVFIGSLISLPTHPHPGLSSLSVQALSCSRPLPKGLVRGQHLVEIQ